MNESAGISDTVWSFKSWEDDNCSLCLNYKKPKSRPLVGSCSLVHINFTVAMHLRQVGNFCILNLIYQAPKFRVRPITHSKYEGVIIDKIFKPWIPLFGISDFLLSENGRELNNVSKENNEQLNINIKNDAGLKAY